jgi:hypothetical protein
MFCVSGDVAMVLRLLFGKPGGKPPTPGNSSAPVPRATEARLESQSKSAAPSKLLKCEVAPPKQTTAAVPHRLLQFFLAQCAKQDFDSTKTMICLAKWAEERNRTSTISSADLDTLELQQIHTNLSAQREIIEAIDELMRSEEGADADEFLEFLEEMRYILGSTSNEIRKICIEKKIDLEAPNGIDKEKKKALSAALRIVRRRFKTGSKESFAALLESALSSTPAELAKHDLISVMNDFRREGKGTVNTTLLEDCLAQSLRHVGKDGDELWVHDTIKQLMKADGSLRRQLLDGLLAAMHNVWDGADPKEARERLDLWVQSAWDRCLPTATLRPLISQLSRQTLDPLAVMRELLGLASSGEEVNASVISSMKDPQLSEAFKNINSCGEIQKLLESLIKAIGGLQLTNPQGWTLRMRTEREKEFMAHLSAMNEHLLRTWQLLTWRCAEMEIDIIDEPRPFGPSEKKLIEKALKTAFNHIDDDLKRPAGEWIEKGIRSARVLVELDSIRDHFNRTGTVKPELEDLVYDALDRVGVTNSSERRKLAQDARLGVIKLTAEYGRDLLDILLRALSDEKFGLVSKDKLVATIRDMELTAQLPGARDPEGTLESKLATVQSVEQAADWIHNLGLKLLQDYPDEKLADAVQSYLKKQGVTPEQAREFLRYAYRARMDGRRAIVRKAIRDFLWKEEARKKI